MKSIGVRVEPTKINYTILDKENSELYSESLNIPKVMEDDVPRQLSFIRTTLYSIICEYDVKYAGLRTAEGSTQNLNIFRINIEGVIKELFSDSTIESYFTGTLNSMASRLEVTVDELKSCIDGKTELFDIKWSEISKNKRESVLASLAALNSNEGVFNNA